VFEQSYGIVDGDSASMAELCALLSVLSDIPIRQNLAMTGSVNQHGVAQPIGGVNEKVEGFFDACFARGLTGTQGVLIPESNVKHLMLRRDVVEHAAEGLFHVRAFRNVDEAIELLTGVPSGRRMPAGVYEPESIYARVQQRLAHMADVARQWGPRAESRGGELA
jgi:predicted ATP-dependent protease